MKVNIAGDTPMERLTNFTKKLVAVPKSEIAALEKGWRSKKLKTRKRRRAL
jgi:hypothetical protein